MMIALLPPTRRNLENNFCCLLEPGVVPGIFRQGAESSDRGLKYGFQGTTNAKNLRQNGFSPSDGGLACSDWGL